jgi:hypothetical protein
MRVRLLPLPIPPNLMLPADAANLMPPTDAVKPMPHDLGLAGYRAKASSDTRI